MEHKKNMENETTTAEILSELKALNEKLETIADLLRAIAGHAGVALVFR